MKYFLHAAGRIRVTSDTADWQGTPAEFAALEPDYPGLPDGMALRYQTEERQYLQDANGVQFPDAFNALVYADNLPGYPVPPYASDVRRFGDVDAGNYAAFEADGTLRLSGNASYFLDENIDALTIKTQGQGVAANADNGTLDFLPSADLLDYAYANVQLNHDRNPVTAIGLHLHFFQAENAAPNFLIAYRWQRNGKAAVSNWTYAPCNALAFAYPGSPIVNIASAQPLAPPSDSSISDIVQVRYLRDTPNDSGLFSGADPYTASAGALSFDIHKECDTLGSREVLSK